VLETGRLQGCLQNGKVHKQLELPQHITTNSALLDFLTGISRHLIKFIGMMWSDLPKSGELRLFEAIKTLTFAKHSKLHSSLRSNK